MSYKYVVLSLFLFFPLQVLAQQSTDSTIVKTPDTQVATNELEDMACIEYIYKYLEPVEAHGVAECGFALGSDSKNQDLIQNREKILNDMYAQIINHQCSISKLFSMESFKGLRFIDDFFSRKGEFKKYFKPDTGSEAEKHQMLMLAHLINYAKLVKSKWDWERLLEVEELLERSYSDRPAEQIKMQKKITKAKKQIDDIEKSILTTKFYLLNLKNEQPFFSFVTLHQFPEIEKIWEVPTK